uniref:KN motif and ankyrin repeat domains 4 n=1 Tax=Gasterosteus aculeatus TaxID=69293 RepID=G3NUQ5_GASAC
MCPSIDAKTKASEGSIQKKQLPYSVETPYGFHLDLDFLKYVDDIEKGNTIKRVHIQRRVKSPAKFSTLPRNFSLPGHGARPPPKDKDSTWSGTSTLGPKPKSRVTEVQQIYDFRASEGGTSSHIRAGHVSAKPRDELGAGAKDVEERTSGIQSRPNLLRASSMPITLQQRKASDSSSPDRVVGTPESGSTENVFRASPDITERRCIPQDRTGLHQQITVALKRVRELEEQVKTIPELKAQICSLREEREKLLLQLHAHAQAQSKAQVSSLPSTIASKHDSGTHTQPQGQRPSAGLNTSAHLQTSRLSEQELQTETLESTQDDAVQKLSQDIAGQELTSLREALKDAETSKIQNLQEKLMILEAKLTQASQDLERTNTLLKEQMDENKVKEERILQLSDGVTAEACTPEAQNRPRRESIDTGTETERVDFTHQETETEIKGVPVHLLQNPGPKPRVEDSSLAERPSAESSGKQTKPQPRSETQGAPPGASVKKRPKSIQAQTRRHSKELKASQPPGGVPGESQTRPTGQVSHEAQPSSQGSRRSSAETQAPQKMPGETQSGSGESPTSPAALGQVVTRLTGLLGEQWAQLGSSTTAGKAAGKPGPSKMSSIQSQLVSSLSVLSAFYSPGQKAAAASKQRDQGRTNTPPPPSPPSLFLFIHLCLKSIMKKNGVADKQGNKGAKKNLKFVGVNGGYESTSSEESSGDEKSKVEVEEEKGSSSPEEKDAEVSTEGGGAVAAETEGERGLLDIEGSQELPEEKAEGEKVNQGFIDACLYVKDRMEEVSSPDKEMRQVLVVLYQEWFKISSQKESQADTVRLYLRQVGFTTPTLLPYVVNLTDGNGNMALHYSVSHSNFPVVKLLLDTGLCETDNVNKAGYTPVMLAALTAAESSDDLEVAQQLLRMGDVNACSRQAGQTALMLAVSHGRVAMVKLLLSCGADVNAQDREGSTALMCASEHGHTNIVRMLLETGRCDSTLTDKNGQTARSVAEGAAHQEIRDLLKAHAETRGPESFFTT